MTDKDAGMTLFDAIDRVMRVRVPMSADDCLACQCAPDGFVERASEALVRGEQIGYCARHYAALVHVLLDFGATVQLEGPKEEGDR